MECPRPLALAPFLLGAVAALTSRELTAQSGDHYVPDPDWELRITARALPQLAEGWRGSALRRALREPAAAAAVAAVGRVVAERLAADRAAVDHANRLGRVLDADEALGDALLRLPFDAVRTIELSTYAGDGRMPWQRPLWVLEPLPAGEGRLTAALERLRQNLASCRGVSLASGDVTAFEPTQFRDDSERRPVLFVLESNRVQPWLLRLPGQIVVGDGAPERDGTFGARPAAAPPARAEVAFAVKLDAGVDPWVGLDSAGTARCAFTWVGDDAAGRMLQGELELPVDAADDSVCRALLQATGAPPALPWSADALAQLRLALAPAAAIAALGGYLDAARLPGLDALGGADRLAAAFAGGVALNALAPAPGTVAPRLQLALTVADADAARQAVAAAVEAFELATAAAERDGLACTAVVDGAGVELAAFAVVDDVLCATVPADGLPALVRGAPTTSTVGWPEPPEPGPDERALPVALRYDVGRIAATLLRVWAEQAPDPAEDEWERALVDALRGVDPDALRALLGEGLGALSRRGDTLLWRERSAVAGPATLGAAGAHALFTGLLVAMGNSLGREPLERRLAQRRLELAGQALRGWLEHHDRPTTFAALAGRDVLDAAEAEWLDATFAIPLDERFVRTGDDDVAVLAYERSDTGPWLVLDTAFTVHEVDGDRARRDLGF